MAEEADNETIHFHSGVAFDTKEPFVSVFWGTMEGQMSPDEADAHAVAVVHAAQAARHDAAIVSEMIELGLDQVSAAKFLGRIRERLNMEDSKNPGGENPENNEEGAR